jgi:1-acyl-sn-glycerol-3-phosphate acyltransferase
VTIPHRRHLSFWAKSSLFKNPIVGTILSSSGAIPVNRNPDNAHTSETSTQSTQSNLFLATTYALSRGEAIGVFPEGTSYTEPRIMQVKGGAGWAAVEYAKWEVEHGQRAEGGRLVVIPVAVVYTDKTVYRSRVSHLFLRIEISLLIVVIQVLVRYAFWLHTGLRVFICPVDTGSLSRSTPPTPTSYLQTTTSSSKVSQIRSRNS